MSKSILKDKSYSFAIKIVKLSQQLQSEKKELLLSKQIIRSGISVGALIREAEFGQSKADFIHKMSIALKEANETDYWLNILYDTYYIDKAFFNDSTNDCNELISLLVATVKTCKRSIE